MKNFMKSRIGLFFTTYILLILIFIVQKPIFMLYHSNLSFQCSFSEWLNVMVAGLPMDMSVAGYLMLIPSIILLVSVFTTKFLKPILCVYFILVSILIPVIFVPDLELYSYWGFRIDATIFAYISSPQLALASQSIWLSIVFFLVAIAYGLGLYYIFYKLIIKFFPIEKSDKKISTFILLFIFTGLLLIPIRGGVTTSTMNPGRVFFSDNMFLNHAATNPAFNLFYSLTLSDNVAEKYHFMTDTEADAVFVDLMSVKDTANVDRLLNTNRPNIVFIILESFGKTVIESLGGMKGITPNLSKLTAEGILFNNMYANSFRTDRGLVSVLAGYPPHPGNSIFKYANKTQALNSIPKSLINNGYDASFLHGGDLDFAQMKMFVVSQKVTDITVDKDFPITDRLTKWGVPDEISFRYLTENIRQTKKEPFLKIFLTLSSHEPFDVPTNKFQDGYLNSIAYADSCLGVFIDNLKQSPQWDNTLVVLVADHDALYPEVVGYNTPERHDIFMLWLGGAVKHPKIIEKYCSQADIAATLLSQLDIPYKKDFPFSKDIVNPTSKGFAFYTFSDGFGMMSDKGRLVYDHDNIVFRQGTGIDSLLMQGKAYMQTLCNDFQKK